MTTDLSQADLGHLSDFKRLLDIIHDRTLGVAIKNHTGVYLTGRPGTSKTWTVENTLKESGVPFITKNARMSPMGLWTVLRDHPEHVVVLDDMGSLVQDKQTLPILLAALGGHPGKPRRVTYTTLDKNHSFDFRGGIIAISNLTLKRDPMVDALASRCHTLEHDPSDEMIRAFMRAMTVRPYKNLTLAETKEVVEFLCTECNESNYRLDMRYLEKGWEDMRLAKNEDSRCHWQDLIRSSLKKVYASEMVSKPSGRDDKRAWLDSIGAELWSQYPNDRTERERLWLERTGMPGKSMYRYKPKGLEG